MASRKEHEFDLELFLPYRLNLAAEQLSRSFSVHYQKRYGMTRSEWRVLANLGQHGRLTAKRICSLSHLHKTKVSRSVASLEKRGWLTRKPNPDDRREEWLELKSAGKTAYREITRLGLSHDRQLVARLGEEDACALIRALDALQRVSDS